MKNWYNRKITIQLATVVFLISVIPVSFFFGVSYYFTKQKIQEELEISAQYELQTAISRVETLIAPLSHANSVLSAVEETQKDFFSQNTLAMVDCIDVINESLLYLPAVKNIILFSNEFEYLFTSSSTYQKDFFLRKYSDFSAIFLQSEQATFSYVTIASATLFRDAECLPIVYHNYNVLNETENTIVFLLSTQALLEQLNSQTQASEFILFNQENELLFSTLPDEQIARGVLDENNFYWLNGNKYYTTASTSLETGTTLFQLKEASLYLAPLQSIVASFLFILVGLCICILILIGCVLISNYKIIDDLLLAITSSQLQNKSPPPQLKHLSRQIIQLINESSTLKQLYDAEKDTFSANYVAALLSGFLRSEDAQLKNFSFLDFDEEYPFYRALIVKVNDKNDEIKYTQILELNTPHLKQKTFIMQNVVVILCNYATRETFDSFVMQLYQGLFSRKPTIAIGNRTEQLFDIHNSYMQARVALSYRGLQERGRIIFYQNLKEQGRLQVYPYDLIRGVVASVYAADLEKTEKALTALQTFTAQNEISLAYCKLFYHDLIINIHHSSKDLFEQMSERLLEKASVLLNLTDVAEVEEMVQDFCNDVIASNVVVTHYDRITLNTFEYVKNNYTDYNLSVSGIAQAFSISPDYLSSVFKKDTNTVLIKYINNYRIEQVVQQLRFSSDSIQSIAQSCGYYNMVTFRKNFKDIMGISATQYQKTYCSQNEGDFHE